MGTFSGEIIICDVMLFSYNRQFLISWILSETIQHSQERRKPDGHNTSNFLKSYFCYRVFQRIFFLCRFLGNLRYSISIILSGGLAIDRIVKVNIIRYLSRKFKEGSSDLIFLFSGEKKRFLCKLYVDFNHFFHVKLENVFLIHKLTKKILWFSSLTIILNFLKIFSLDTIQPFLFLNFEINIFKQLRTFKVFHIHHKISVVDNLKFSFMLKID